MASSSAAASSLSKFIRQSPMVQRGAQQARQDIFGHKPNLNLSSGGKAAKQSLTGPYLAKYYPTSINKYARQIHKGWETEQEEYRRIKLTQRRRKGKGPPQKGAGARSGKKKK